MTDPHPILGLLSSIANLFWALVDVAGAAAQLLVAHWFLTLWLVFWLFCVRWPSLREQLVRGGWIALLLVYAIATLTWESIDGVAGWTYETLGAKLLVVGFLVVLTFLMSSLQNWMNWAPAEIEFAGPPDGVPGAADHGHSAHGHEDAHGHGHGAHDHH